MNRRNYFLLNKEEKIQRYIGANRRNRLIETTACYIPPARRLVKIYSKYDGTNVYSLPFPHTVFCINTILVERWSVTMPGPTLVPVVDSAFCWFLQEVPTKPVCLSDLKLVPLPHIYSSGKVCMGRLNKLDIDSFIIDFFASTFMMGYNVQGCLPGFVLGLKSYKNWSQLSLDYITQIPFKEIHESLNDPFMSELKSGSLFKNWDFSQVLKEKEAQ